MLTALYLMQCFPKKGLLRHVTGLGDSHPSHGAHVPPDVPGAKEGQVGLNEGGRQKRSQCDSRRARQKKREPSASHLDGKIPPILEIRMESPRQSTLAPPRLTICMQAPSGLVGFNPE